MTDKEKDELIKYLMAEYRHGWLIWSTPEVYCGYTLSRYWENVYQTIIKTHENL